MKTKLLLVLALAFSASLISAAPLDTAFTYQGKLAVSGAPASGSYDLTFTLYGDASGGTAVAGPLTNSPVSVSNGLFTVAVDFGFGIFTGDARWLEIGVRTNGSLDDFISLAPRQALTATPYALHALSAGAAASAVAVTGPVAASQLTGTISSNNIGAGSITMPMIASGAVGANQLAAGAVTTTALANGAVTAAKVATVSNWFLALTITNPTPANYDWFGNSVAAMGNDRVLVGAYSDDEGLPGAGVAHLFTSGGALLTTFTNPAPFVGNSGFGRVVAGVDGGCVLVGAPENDSDSGALQNAGVAYLFRTNGTLLTVYTNPSPAAYDEFGWSVAGVGSDHVLIGAYRKDVGALNDGAAYLFNTNGTLLTTFTNPTPANSDEFGYALAAMGNDRVIISALRDNTGAAQAGAAYLFRTDGTLLTTFTNPTPAADDFFGNAVAALGNDLVLIGALSDDTGGINTGAVYLFNTNGTLLVTLTNPAPVAGETLGRSVASLGHDRVLAGADWSDRTYVFSTSGALLSVITNPVPGNFNRFGGSVAAVGTDQILVGAWRDDTGATDTGAAYLFAIETFAQGVVADGVRAGSITADRLAAGAVGSAQLTTGAVISSKIASGAITQTQLANGAVGTAQLAAGSVTTSNIADGAVTAVKIASNSITAEQLANGAVGSAQLAAGAVTSSKIAGGAVGSSQLAYGAVGHDQLAARAVTATKIADGAIGSTQLAKPPRAGRIVSTSLDLKFNQAPFSVSFSPPFNTTPVVTLSLETDEDLGAESAFFLSSKTSDGFSGRWRAPLNPAPVTSYFSGLHASMALVNGNPAISYDDTAFPIQGLKYTWANDSYGTYWGGTVVTLDSSGQYTSLAVVNGNPAISYYDYSNGDLKYVRASNASGSSWAAPATIHSTGNVGRYTSLAVVNGNPAISYYDYGNGDLVYIRANDVNGTSWAAPVTLDSAGDVGQYTSLAVVNGNPAISYYDAGNGDLKFIRANDANGTTWASPVTLDSAENVGRYTSLAVVSGRPAISYYGFGALKYVRANDNSGTSWATPVTVDINSGACNSLAIINGKPAISYAGYGDGNKLRYVRANDVQGTSWGTPIAVDIIMNNPNAYTSLEQVDGQPAISYVDPDKGLRFVRQPDVLFTIHWIALEP